MVPGDIAIQFPKHKGIKCYAMLAGECWLIVDGVPEPMLVRAGDCFVLPRGLPFQLLTDLSLKPMHLSEASAQFGMKSEATGIPEGARYMAGGHFVMTGGPAEMLLSSLPPVIHIRRESDRAAKR